MRRILVSLAILVAAVTGAFGLTPAQRTVVLAPQAGLFGLNLSGPEFAPWNGQVFPSAADWARINSYGVKFVRLPIAWEQIQPALSGALAAPYLASIKSALASANRYGIGVIIDIHNFGHYCLAANWQTTGCGYAGNAGVTAASVQVFGDGTLTTTVFADLWTKLATALTGTPGLIGYDLMNEPTNLVGTNLIVYPNYLTGLGNIGTKPWNAPLNGAVITQLPQGSNPLGATYGPAWDVTSGTGFGGVTQTMTLANVAYIMSCNAKVTASTHTFQFQFGGGASGANTATTSWQRFTYTATAAAGSNPTGFFTSSGTGFSIQFANCQLELGSSASAYIPNIFLAYAQAGITAIRTVDKNTPIYVGGDRLSVACLWPAVNFELNQLTGGNLIFESHQYPDGTLANCGGGGTFSSNYSAFAGLTDQTGVAEITAFSQWLQQFGYKGYLGEYAIVNSTADSNESWYPLKGNVEHLLAQTCMQSSMWFYGSQTVGNAQNIYLSPAIDPRTQSMLSVGRTKCRS